MGEDMQATVTNIMKVNELIGKRIKVEDEYNQYEMTLNEVYIIPCVNSPIVGNLFQFQCVGRNLSYHKEKEDRLYINDIWGIIDAETHELIWDCNGWKEV
jgi:hypothetical protein